MIPNDYNEVGESAEDQFLGFNKKTVSDAIYLEVFQGTICQRTKEAREGWEGPITTTNPQTGEQVNSYVQRYDNIVVRIVDCEQYKKEFESGGKQAGFKFTVLAGKNKAILRLTWIEVALKRLLKCAPYIDFAKPLYISVFPRREAGRVGTACQFKQGEGPDPSAWVNIPEFYNKENAEMPQGIHDEMADTWDFAAQNKFLGQKFVNEALPRIKAAGAAFGYVPPPAAPQAAQAPQAQYQAPQYNPAAQAPPPVQQQAPPVQQRPQETLPAFSGGPVVQQGQGTMPPILTVAGLDPQLNPPPVAPPVQQQPVAMPPASGLQAAPFGTAFVPPQQPQGPATDATGSSDDDIPF